jgi:hypothetical protein
VTVPLLASAALALAVVVGIARRSRARAARRWNAALEGYADREIARARGRKAATGGEPRGGARLHRGPRLGQAKRSYPRKNRHARPQSQDR